MLMSLNTRCKCDCVMHVTQGFVFFYFDIVSVFVSTIKLSNLQYNIYCSKWMLHPTTQMFLNVVTPICPTWPGLLVL